MAFLSPKALAVFLNTPDAALRTGYKTLKHELLKHKKSLEFEGQNLDFDSLHEKLDLYKGQLERAGIKPTVELCIAAYLKESGEYKAFGARNNFGRINHYPAAALASSALYINKATQNELNPKERLYPFAHAIKNTVHNALEMALAAPETAPLYVQILYTHEPKEGSFKRRNVRHSRVDMTNAIIKYFLERLDWATLSLSKRYICSNSQDKNLRGIRTANVEWMEIAREIEGGTYVREFQDPKTGKISLIEEPTSAFWGAVALLKDKDVISSQKVARKVKQKMPSANLPDDIRRKKEREIRALPSIKTINRDFLLDCGVKEESLDKAQELAKESQLKSFKAHLNKLKADTINKNAELGLKLKCIVDAMKSEAQVILKALDKGRALFKSVCPHLQIPIIHELGNKYSIQAE